MSDSFFVAVDFDQVWTTDYNPVIENISYALAACSLNPVLELGPAIDLAELSYKKHRDSITMFAEEHDIDRETMHRLAHRIVNKTGWRPQEGISEAFATLQQIASDTIIWTHGCRRQIPYSASLVGGYGLIKPSMVFDINSLGRKDVGPDPYHKIGKMRDHPDSCPKLLIDDNVSNLECANAAGWLTMHVRGTAKKPVKATFIDYSAETGVEAFRVATYIIRKSSNTVVPFEKPDQLEKSRQTAVAARPR